MTEPFRIGITSDFHVEAPGRLDPVLHEILAPLPHVEYTYFHASGADARGAFVLPTDVANFDAVLNLAYRFTPDSFSSADRLAVIARWGVGYDMINVPACTQNDVLLAITTDAVRRPVAEAILTLLLALAKQLPARDRIVRQGRWDLRASPTGLGLRGKTVGSVGVGNIGAEMFRLLEPFELERKLAADPYIMAGNAAALGVERVDLETVFRESDFVTINCPLTTETRGLVNADLIGLMKPTAFLINTARGPIVNQAHLLAALQEDRIAGAGLDVFENEPIPADDPLVQLDNVILSPHSLAWTDELYQDNGVGACENILSVLRGDVPKYSVNRAVAEREGFQQKLSNLRARWKELAQ